MDPKKALMKGLRSISRDEFIEAANLFAEKIKDEKEVSFDADTSLREKYPVYDEAFQMLISGIRKNPDEKAILHWVGMMSAFEILIHIAERR